MKKQNDLIERFETLVAENARLNEQIKQLKREKRDLVRDLNHYVGAAEHAAKRERNWPGSLTLRQQMHQFGLLLAYIVAHDETGPVVKELLGDMIEQLARRCQQEFPRLVQSLEAHHVFPKMALALCPDEKRGALGVNPPKPLPEIYLVEARAAVNAIAPKVQAA